MKRIRNLPSGILALTLLMVSCVSCSNMDVSSNRTSTAVETTAQQTGISLTSTELDNLESESAEGPEQMTGPAEGASVANTENEETAVSMVYGEIPIEQARRILLTLSVGSEEEQLGYYYNSKEDKTIGPSSFAVKDDVICILDNENKRVVIYQNGKYSNIDINEFPHASILNYGNGKIGVTDNKNHTTGVYSLDGTRLALIEHPEVVKKERVAGLEEIGNRYVVWKTFLNGVYRYDWKSDTFDSWETPIWKDSYYEKYDADSGKYIVGMYLEDGNTVYVKIDMSAWETGGSFYYTENGAIYMMECFEKEVVISEIKLFD